MSNSDTISSAIVKISPSLSTASESPEIPEDTVRRPPSQPPSAPPPPPPPLLPPYRAVAPLNHRNPFQRAHGNVYAQSIPNILPNQDPSTILQPFVPRGRGFSVRPVRMRSPLVTDPILTETNQIRHPLRPVSAYSQRQFGPNQMEAMMQFMRARNPQIHQFPVPGSGSPVGSGPMRGNSHFLQPRVASPSTSIVETSRSKRGRSRDEELALIRGRKVRITEGASLYSLSRSWLRNGAQGGIQPKRSHTTKPLPKPLPVEMMETSVLNDPAEKPANDDKEDEESVKHLSEKDILKRHIERAKKVRARFREERWKKIKRFKARILRTMQEEIIKWVKFC